MIKRGLWYLPILFIFIKIPPIAMFVASHYNETNEREKQSDPSQSQRSSLYQVFPLPPLQYPCYASGWWRWVFPISHNWRRWWSLNVYPRGRWIFFDVGHFLRMFFTFLMLKMVVIRFRYEGLNWKLKIENWKEE